MRALCLVIVSLLATAVHAAPPTKKKQPAVEACDFGDDVTCPKRCAAGSLESCYYDLRRHPGVAKQEQFLALCAKGHGGSCNAAGLGTFAEPERWITNEEIPAAQPLFEKGCAAGSAKACNNLGHFLKREALHQQERVLPFFLRACELDDVSSLTGCVEAANMMRDGTFGTAVDVPRAARLYAQACRLGHPASCAEATRHGVPSTLSPIDDTALADRFCRRGDLRACRDFGTALWEGRGTAVDKAAADRVLGIACDGDQEPGRACGSLGNLRLGVDWLHAAPPLQRACEHEHGRSCRRLADLVLVGQGVVADRARAETLYAKACRLDAPQGCNAAGALASSTFDPTVFFTSGCGTGDKDACAALERLGIDPTALKQRGEQQRAAEDERACRQDSSGVACDRAASRANRAKDFIAARALFDFACRAGVTRSCRAMVNYAADGTGGPKDPDTAATAAVRGCVLGDDVVCKTAKAWLRTTRTSAALDDARAEMTRACAAGVAGACP